MFASDPTVHWAWTVLGLLSIPALVALNGFFVAAEFSLVAVRRTRVEEMVNQGVPRAKAVEAAVMNLDRSIAATQLGITLASIALGWVGEWALARLVEPWFNFLPPDLAFVSRHALAIAVAFTIVTFMHVVFGELIPKAIALQTPDRTALWISPPLNLFCLVSRPAVSVLNGVGNFLVRKMGYLPSGTEGHIHSVEELRLLVEDTGEAGLIDAESADYVMNVFALSDKKVRDIMVPWEKVMALELTTPHERILEAVRDGSHTRMPVYEGTPDHIVGVVNTKDLFFLFSLKGVVVLEDAIYPTQFLPPDEPVSTALRLFRRTHRPMAVVRDPEGKIHGILTLEDVLEEIIGDIEDEHDDPARRRAWLARVLRRTGRKQLPPG